jgi:hypothetical protein
MIGRLLVLGLLLAQPPALLAWDVAPDRYRAAAAAGQVGSVTGRVYDERRRPDGADQAFAGAAVTLMPRSAEFLRKLESVKSTARTSLPDYRAAAPAIQALKAAYERDLWESGAADLVVGAVTASDGRFSVENLPAGPWVLIVVRSVTTDVHHKEAATAKKERGVYAPGTHLTGYRRLTIWLREVTVSGDRTESLDLIDRGAWFSGVVEERAPNEGGRPVDGSRTPAARPAAGASP